MAELFKNVYNQPFFDLLTNTLEQLIPDFSKTTFLKDIYDNEWETRELKQRMRHITVVLNNHLSDDFEENAKVVLSMIAYLQANGHKERSLEFMFFPDFIEVYGIEHYEASISAFETITQFTSCEFAVRPFIIKYQEPMMQQMYQWSSHKHPMVRRLATEGCRPRLPWAMAIPSLKANPESILPILENLKNDVSESVRRSVANNLNDISKDNADTVIALAKKWQGETQETDWLVKHGCRTMLKQGGAEVMQLFGFGAVDTIEIKDFQILTPKVKVGGFLEISATLINKSASSSKLRLEYGLYYMKANGSLARKVFKISEKEYAGNSTTSINRKQSFKIITTRKFHLGKHQVAFIINGQEFDALDFELMA